MSGLPSLFSVMDGRKNRDPSIGAGAKGTPLVVRKKAEKLFSHKVLVLSGAIASLFLQPTATLAGLGYVTHWDHFDTSGANAAFNGPTDVAFLKSNGNMVIVDSNAGVTGGGEVVVQQTNGTYVTKLAALNNLGPVRAAVDSNSGDAYISTYYESKIRRYTEAGGTLTLADTWTGCTANGGNGPYTWGKTFGVAVDSTGAIYVADYDGLRIIKMNTAGQCLAAPLTTYTKNGTAGQVFLNPTGLAVDSADNLWVTDYGKKVLVKYNSAGVWQTTLTGFTNCGATTAFSSPKDIDIDPATNDMFITDSGATMGIVKLDSSGNFLTKTYKYNTNTSFSSPFGSGYTSGYLYATDYGHSAVVKYQNSTRKVSVTASANGTVAADVGGLITGTTGGNTCVDQFVDATTVVLTATPASGYTTTWGGADGAACTGNTCTLTSIGSDKVVTATFAAAPAVNPAPPLNPFNPAGTSTVSIVAPTGTSYTPASIGLVTNIGSLGNKVGISDNGVVVIQDAPKEPVKIKSDAPDNVLFSVPDTKNVPIQVGGKQINVVSNGEPVKGADGKDTATVLATKTLTNEQGESVQSLQVVSGQAQFTSSQDNQMVGGLTLSKDSNLRDVVATSGAMGSSVGFYKNPTDFSGAVSSEKGDVVVVVKLSGTSGKTAGFAADTSTKTLTLKEGEVARFNSAGELTGVYVGSLSGTAGKTGDALSVTIPANVVRYPHTNIAKLDGNNLGRLGDNLLRAFADVASPTGLATGSGNTVLQDSATGVASLVTGGRNFYGLPLLPVTVDTSVADGVVRNNDATVTWTQKGISVRFAPAISDISKFAADSQSSFASTTQVLENGSLKLTRAGVAYIGRPRFESEPSLTSVRGFQWNSEFSRATYTDAQGKTQVIDPMLFDAGQIAQTLSGMGTGWAMQSELDGTLKVTGPDGSVYRLVPDYAVSLEGASGKTAPSAWSAQGDKVYYLYSAPIVPMLQGFTLRK